MSILAGTLANHIKGRSLHEVAALTNHAVSRETLRRVMQGGRQLKLSNLAQLSSALELSHDEWLTLLCAWIETTVGKHARDLTIQPAKVQSKTSQFDKDQFEAVQLFRALPPQFKKTVINLMRRRDFLPTVQALLCAGEKIRNKAKLGYNNGNHVTSSVTRTKAG